MTTTLGMEPRSTQSPMRKKTLSTTLRSLTALAVIAVIGAGCANAPSETGTAGSGGNENTTPREQAVRFAECMRENGVREFPDPDASGGLTVDGVVNGSSLNPSTPAWKKAIGACHDLQPPGFMGHRRSAEQQQSALEFAQCVRDNGVKDFPDPTRDGALVDTNRIPSAAGKGARSIPGLQAALQKCGAVYSDELGLKRR